MQHIKIETLVAGNYREVMAGFDKSLFSKLAPPGTGLEVKRFDGSTVGDEVHLRVKLLGLIPQDWVSVITEAGNDADHIWFVDEGKSLPFFLSEWRHRHIVENMGNHARIVDDIYFSGGNAVMDRLLYPVLYAQFAWRSPIYRKHFGKV